LTAPDELINPDTSEVNKLTDEQKNDETLHGAFERAKNNKGGYFLKYDLLFHRTYIRDSVVDRLVVPLCRHILILDLAHSQVGCHIGVRRTKERIALSFTWPTLINDVIKYC